MSDLYFAFIIRGIPGVGKSTLARTLNADPTSIHSTDNYFYRDGNYCFDWCKLKEYHQRNFEAFCRSLKAKKPIVVCDNTNVHYWNFMPYRKAAEAEGYRVAIISLPHIDAHLAAQRTLHGAPVKTIQKMIDEWEY